MPPHPRVGFLDAAPPVHLRIVCGPAKAPLAFAHCAAISLRQAVPIGLHAAWNFAGWTAGGRAETGLLRMTLEDEALGRTEAVGTASYLVLNATLTLAFWLLHRRNVRRGRAFTSP